MTSQLRHLSSVDHESTQTHQNSSMKCSSQQGNASKSASGWPCDSAEFYLSLLKRSAKGDEARSRDHDGAYLLRGQAVKMMERIVDSVDPPKLSENKSELVALAMCLYDRFVLVLRRQAANEEDEPGLISQTLRHLFPSVGDKPRRELLVFACLTLASKRLINLGESFYIADPSQSERSMR